MMLPVIAQANRTGTVNVTPSRAVTVSPARGPNRDGCGGRRGGHVRVMASHGPGGPGLGYSKLILYGSESPPEPRPVTRSVTVRAASAQANLKSKAHRRVMRHDYLRAGDPEQ